MTKNNNGGKGSRNGRSFGGHRSAAGRAESGRSSRNHSGSRGRDSRENRFRNYPQYTGTVQMTREGNVYVVVEGEDGDVFVKKSKTLNALNGDTVRVAVTKEAVGKQHREGSVIEVLERCTKPHIGILHFVGKQCWVLMQSKSMPYDIEVDAELAASMGGKTGMKAAAIVDSWPRHELNPKGHVVDVLGMPGDNDTEMHAILAEYGLPYRFEKEVEDEAAKISQDITAKEIARRRDMRGTLTFTIDPADAKDFDDALSFKRLDDGNFEVGVHIADVSHYVLPGTLLDKEAQERGTSVYLVDRTVPMLPEILCNNLCSLRPNEDKLTFSTIFVITPRGRLVDRWFGRTVINSDRRYNYDEAQAVIEKGMADAKFKGADDVEAAVLELYKLSQIFRKRRFAAGAMNFDRPEMKVEVDEKGRPIKIYEKVSKEANWLIEEFMLLANRSVAEFIATDGKMNGVASRKAKTFVYRVHDVPNTEKVENLRNFAGNFGYKMGETNGPKAVSKTLNSLLEESKGKPEFEALQLLALRSMAKAKYSTDNIGHYGLAFDFYTHFTSPIRRYPDTMVHRLLAMYLDGKESQSKDYYEQQCVHASEREGIAADAERASVKYKLVEYMQDKLGLEFDGHISGLTDWGMYVEIEPTKIEGMIALREIKSDWYEFDEDHYCLRGRRTQKVYRLGDAVRIRVKNANLEQKLLDYELIEPASVNAPSAADASNEAPSSAPSHRRRNTGFRAEGSHHGTHRSSKPGKSSGSKPRKSGK